MTTATEHKIISSLSEAVGITRGKKEGIQRFLKKLVTKCDDLPEEKWDALSNDTQDWLNEAARAVRDKRDIPVPGDSETGNEDEEDSSDDDTNSDSQGGTTMSARKKKTTKKKTSGRKKKTTKKKTAKKKASGRKKKTKSTGARRGRTVNTDGNAYRTVEIITKNPTASKGEIAEKTEKAGCRLADSTLGAVYFYARLTLLALGEIKQ